MAKDTGGAAFPTYSPNPIASGMTLRDWFAGQIVAQFLTDKPLLAEVARHEKISPLKYAAKCAYEVADAMLEARK